MVHKYDAIVIGAGISGLGVGALLTCAGKKVIVLEKSKLIGGRATSFKYQGYICNVGEHAGLVGGNFDTLIEAVGKKSPDRGIFEDVIIYHDGKFENILDFYPRINFEESARTMEAFNAITDEEMPKYDAMSATEWLSPLIKTEANWQLSRLLGIIFNTIPNLEDMAASSLIEGMKLTMKSLSSFLAAYGIGSYSRVLADKICEEGGVVKTRARVTRILLEGKHVRGVEMEQEGEPEVNVDGPLGLTEVIEAPIVVSAIPVWEILKLLPEGDFPPGFVKKARNLNRVTANLGFYAGLKEPLYTEKQFIVTDLPTVGYPTTIFISSNLCPTLAPRGRHLFECSSILPYSIGEDRALLHRKLAEMKQDVDAMWPGWEKKVLWTRPYFRWEEPARNPGCEGVFKPGPAEAGIAGLFLAGDSVNSRTTPGMECASDSAMICAKAILGKLPEVRKSEPAAAVKKSAKAKPASKNPKGKKAAPKSKRK